MFGAPKISLESVAVAVVQTWETGDKESYLRVMDRNAQMAIPKFGIDAKGVDAMWSIRSDGSPTDSSGKLLPLDEIHLLCSVRVLRTSSPARVQALCSVLSRKTGEQKFLSEMTFDFNAQSKCVRQHIDIIWAARTNTTTNTTAEKGKTPHPAPGSKGFLDMLGPYPGRAPDSGGPPVQHNVMFDMKASDTDVKAWFEGTLRPAINKMPGVASWNYGPYTSFEGFNKAFNWGMSFVFIDQYSRDVWIAHEEHEKGINLLMPLLRNGPDSVVAFDHLLEQGKIIARQFKISTTINFGVAGTSEIGPKVIPAMRDAPTTRILGVGSRDVTKAVQYCGKHNAGEGMSYDDLLARKDIDVVYVPFPSRQRNDFIKKAIAAGKHIYSEKPFAGTVEEMLELIESCTKAGLQWFDGTMWYHSLRTRALEQRLRSGELGNVTRVSASFTFTAPDEAWLEGGNNRTNKEKEPHGCLGDMGVRLCIKLDHNRSLHFPADSQHLCLPHSTLCCMPAANQAITQYLPSCGRSIGSSLKVFRLSTRSLTRWTLS